MNRRIYHWLRSWLKFIGIVVVLCAFVAGFIWLLSYVDALWGTKGVFGTVFFTLIMIITLAVAWIESKDDYIAEQEEQRRIEKSLKKDWTK
jgi:uncharacterized membrane protein